MGWDWGVLVPIFTLGAGIGVGVGLILRFVQRPQRVERKTEIITKP